jgi:hypothetical protein
MIKLRGLLAVTIGLMTWSQAATQALKPFVQAGKKPLQISGVYPHLTLFNEVAVLL